MNNKNYKTYAFTPNYVSNISKNDKFQLGDIVIQTETKEIGIVIQIHDETEVRVDMFGNECVDNLRLATKQEIEQTDYSETSVGNFNHK